MKISETAAVITGAASGLGEATARQFASQGAKVTILDRDVEKGQAVAAEIGGTFVETDVTSEDSVQAASPEHNAWKPQLFFAPAIFARVSTSAASSVACWESCWLAAAERSAPSEFVREIPSTSAIARGIPPNATCSTRRTSVSSSS